MHCPGLDFGFWRRSNLGFTDLGSFVGIRQWQGIEFEDPLETGNKDTLT